MLEWFVPDASIPIRQGDVLIRRDPESRTIHEIRLVITADCDISKQKFGPDLACLRVELFDQYIRNVWGERKLEKLLADETKKLHEQVAKWHKALLATESTLSLDRVVTWVRREEPEQICEELKIPLAQRKGLISNMKLFREALAAKEKLSLSCPLTQYASFLSVLRAKETEICWQEALLQARNEKLPDDIFILPGLPELETNGAIVMLREVVGTEFNKVFTRATDAVDSSVYLRIGRMMPTYKYAISQAFGSLYSRIGLPNEYEERRKVTLENIKNYKLEQSDA